MSCPAERAMSWRLTVALAAVYLAVTMLTQARFMGDTIDYVIEAERFDSTGWEFGHLWWVPLGWALGAVTDTPLSPLHQGDHRVLLTLVFLSVNWVSGLASVLLLAATARRLGLSTAATVAAAMALMFSQAFLNFTQTGSSYVPGLACAMLALYLAVRLDAGSLWGALAAGACLGAAVCFWFPFVLLGPAVVLAPVVLLGIDRARLRFALVMSLGAGLLLVAAYGAAAVAVGVTDVEGFRAWMARASHGVLTRGVGRAIFGLARSFVYSGDDGLLVKRYLLRDPYNPVAPVDLAKAGLWKFGLFYLAMAAMLLGLLRTPDGRRLALLLVVAGVPVIAFGIFWQGGDMERYLPLYPFLFLALAGLWSLPESGAWRWVPAAFFVLVAMINGTAHSRWSVAAHRETLESRVAGLAGRLPPGSQIVVVRDPLLLLPRDALLSEERHLPVAQVAVPGLATSIRWRTEFVELVERAWKAGGDVWLSRRLFADQPRSDSTWAEGDDPRLKWLDVPTFFRLFASDDAVGGDDGFVRLARTADNESMLALKNQ